MKKYTRTRIVPLLLAVILAIPCFQPLQLQAATPKWQKAYSQIIKNWKKIESVSGYDSSYLKSYFGNNYKYDKYFLCDVDGNQTPELFLYSSKMRLTAVFTYSPYSNRVIFLSYDNYYKINRKESALVVKGHWHGAGGSGTKEYCIYQVNNTVIREKYYIDHLGSGYQAYQNGDYSTVQRTKSAYNRVYKKYVKGGKKFANYKKYKLSNKAGLKKIQK